MEILFTSGLIGWLSVVLLGLVIALPYSRGWTQSASDRSFARVLRGRMKLHYWLPALVAIGSFVHAWLPMATHRLPHTSYTGLRLATLALALIVVQIGFGIGLRFGGPERAKLVRRVHFAIMLGIIALLAAHVWLNNGILRIGS